MSTLALWSATRFSLEIHRPSKHLLLRQAIWAKQTHFGPCAVFRTCFITITEATSQAGILKWVALDLHFELVYSSIARPQGRVKIERLFGILNTELLPLLSGYFKLGKLGTKPERSLADLDRAVDTFLIGT